jgi:DNA-directed RNA polymerase subunit RPC12/RpoP
MQAFNSALKAIDAELRSLTSGRSTKRCKVDYYEWIKSIGGNHVYRLWVSDDLKLREDAEITLKSPQQTLVATVISVQDVQCFTVRVAEKLTQELYSISWSFNPGFILKALGEALATSAVSYQGTLRTVSDRVVRNADLSINDGSDFIESLNSAQQQAIRLAESKEVSLIWGPPGTGKTHTLAQVIYRAFLRDETVLVLSTSNVAIDQVLLYLDGFIYSDERQHVARLGYSDNEVCNGYIQQTQDLDKASIIFSTLATAVLKFDALYNNRFDMVVVDEASMVSMPYVYVAASFTARNVVFSGDFRQLPPISLVDGSVMAESIFDHLNIPEAVDQGRPVPYMALLDTQYRMDQEISSVISTLFYNDLLKCGKPQADGHGNASSLEFIDINRATGYCESYYSVEYRSYYNPVTLVIIKARLSEWMGIGAEVLYISPYRAQQNLISYSFIDEGLTTTASSLTVHRAQGAEADIVCFDLTTHARTSQSEYAKMLTSSATKNLVNVAMSRAKRKLVIIGSVESIIDLADREPFWSDFYKKVTDKFTIKRVTPVVKELPRFQATLGEEQAVLAVDTRATLDHLDAISNSQAEKKVYVTTKELPLIKGVTTRTIESSKFPDFLIWGEQVVLHVLGNYVSMSQKMVAEVLKRISVGHLVDLTEPDSSNTHVLSCDKCTGTRDLVYDKSRFRCVLRCSRCGDRTFITESIANDIKAIYQIQCPDCGSDMQARRKKGSRALSFYGCSNYPRCHGLVDFRDYAIDFVD